MKKSVASFFAAMLLTGCVSPIETAEKQIQEALTKFEADSNAMLEEAKERFQAVADEASTQTEIIADEPLESTEYPVYPIEMP